MKMKPFRMLWERLLKIKSEYLSLFLMALFIGVSIWLLYHDDPIGYVYIVLVFINLWTYFSAIGTRKTIEQTKHYLDFQLDMFKISQEKCNQCPYKKYFKDTIERNTNNEE